MEGIGRFKQDRQDKKSYPYGVVDFEPPILHILYILFKFLSVSQW
jgi:hypothetical protein